MNTKKIGGATTPGQRSDEALHEQREWLRVTLNSIGDAVITTDTHGNVTFLNSVAQALTGWSQAEAVGQPLDAVFKIVNEETRKPVENPANRALREGVVVGLANHTLLISKDGTERPIDDSAAPIRSDQAIAAGATVVCNPKGETVGVVLIFRDVSERREQERKVHDRRQSSASPGKGCHRRHRGRCRRDRSPADRTAPA